MALEAQKNELDERILQEQINHPILTRGQITFFLYQFRKIDTHDEDERQRLIDSFVNAVFAFDDKIVMTFNYKCGARVVKLTDLNSSNLVGHRPPKFLISQGVGNFLHRDTDQRGFGEPIGEKTGRFQP